MKDAVRVLKNHGGGTLDVEVTLNFPGDGLKIVSILRLTGVKVSYDETSYKVESVSEPVFYADTKRIKTRMESEIDGWLCAVERPEGIDDVFAEVKAVELKEAKP